MSPKRVAVIGAGASGLTSIKCLLDEGLEPVCYERTDHIGGLWYYTPDSKDGQACVMKSTVINTSKEVMCFSDFPIPQQFPNFMHNTKVLEYFHMYADHFGLKKHIRFNTSVEELKRAPDFATSGQWHLKVKADKDENSSLEVFDAVLLCTGHHADKNIPNFEGASEYTGKIVHPHDYKDHKEYHDKTVVVIGIGNSGGDTSVELSHVCKQVYLSTRRGSWVVNRIGENGYPTDMIGLRRFVKDLAELFPTFYQNLFEFRLNARFNHEKYGLKPSHRVNAQHPTVNDELPNRIACGAIIVKPDVKRFTKTGIEFVDGTAVENVDTIITATGYVFGFPYLEKGIVKVEKNVVDLYKLMFPPHLERNTLAVIGCFQPVGALNPIAEMQARWAARVFKGVSSLPSEGEMWEDIYNFREKMRKQYCSSQRHTIQVDYIAFMDELAAEIGCKPDLKELILSDPTLAYNVYFGTCTPYQYRLMGPNSWSGARQALLTQWDRVLYPLKSSVVAQQNSSSSFIRTLVFIVVVLFILRFVIGII